MTKRKQNGPVNVRHIATGEEWSVPRDVFSAGNAATWIEQQISQRDQNARAAKAAAASQAEEATKAQLRTSELEALIAQQAEVIADLQAKNQKLEQASPEAAAGAMALMSATAQAQQLRTDLQKDMGAIAEWRQKYNEDVTAVADEVRRRNHTLDAEAEERRERNRQMFAELRAQQGLDPHNPALRVEESDG